MPQIQRFYAAPVEHTEISTEQCECELWRDGDWRCEAWQLGGRQQVRLYLGPHLVGDLLDGPGLDLERQAVVWQMSVSEPRGFVTLTKRAP